MKLVKKLVVFVPAFIRKEVLTISTNTQRPNCSRLAVHTEAAAAYLCLRGGDCDSGFEEEHDEEEPNIMKSIRCVLCGQEFVASCQDDCEAHMANCSAFTRVHPESGATNPDGVYPPQEQEQQQHQAPAFASQSSLFEAKQIEEMSVKELRAFIQESGLSDKDCIEKQDLQERARQAASKRENENQ